MDKMFVSAFQINDIATIEIKHNNHYTIVAGKAKGFPLWLLIKCAVKTIWKEICRKRDDG